MQESPIKPSDLIARGTAAGRSSGGIDIESLNAEDLEYNYDVAGLAALRRRMIYAISTYKGDRAQYEEVMLEAFELEDVVKCRQMNDFTPRKPTRSPIKKAVWFYKCALRASWHRILAVVFAALSVLIVWAEGTIVSPMDISPLSLMIKSSEASEFGVQILTLLPLAYICACTYAALFSITAFDYNKLIPRATIGSALMQNGTLMCRFAAPTCWNFYHMIRMTRRDTGGTTTVFEDMMGSMDVPNVLRQHLNTYLPLILVVECIITALNLWDRIMGLCVSSKYKFSNDDDVDDEYTEKGRQLVTREREAMEKGFTIGQVLTSAFFDLDFPDIVGGPRSRLTQQKKGFMGLFGRKSAPAATAPPPPLGAPQRPAGSPAASGPSASASSSTVPRYKSSTAAAAAARWLGRGTGLPDDGAVAPSGASASDLLDSSSAKASLLASRQYDKSPTVGEYDAPGQTPGLDNIFATLSGGGPAPSGAGAGGGSGVLRGGAGGVATAAGGAGGGAGRLGGGLSNVPGAGQPHSEKESLLSGFWRS
ncbi:hypothetical protein Vafri_13639 [Volvox africanus]|uniref:Uncharacterized protein n=1 Tax=Volvox africanus TaxID=51714 RepID=A0A8J4BCH5_9CHLO|nr:hypothetical protein Vafri_13639 [Volvox africanus]